MFLMFLAPLVIIDTVLNPTELNVTSISWWLENWFGILLGQLLAILIVIAILMGSELLSEKLTKNGFQGRAFSWFNIGWKSIILTIYSGIVLNQFVNFGGILLLEIFDDSPRIIQDFLSLEFFVDPPILILSGMIAVLLVTFVAFPIGFVLERLITTSVRQKKAMCPDVVIVNDLLEILSMVEREPAQWTHPAFKRKINSRLEEVAVCVQHHIPYWLPGTDRFTDSWLVETGQKMAAAFRDLRKWVLTPRWDTSSQFTKRIASDLVHAAAGEWDHFERGEPELFQSQVKTLVTQSVII